MRCLALLVTLALAACAGDEGTLAADAGGPDVVSTAHCDYAPLPANANPSGPVTAGAITAGAAEAPLDLPIGSDLGGNTGRAVAADNAGTIDSRDWPFSSGFNASVGLETRPMVKALALTAGEETVVLLKIDVGVAYDGITLDLAQRLGLPGKVLVAASHSHSAPGHYTASEAMGVGFARFRRAQYDALLEVAEAVAREALAHRVPARIGQAVIHDFDPLDHVSRDRRPENDALAGGAFKDQTLALIRVDDAGGEPIAVVPIFGVHGTVMGENSPFMSADAPGWIERVFAERFAPRSDGRQVVVMHLQGAAGDVSPTGQGGVDCSLVSDFCWDFARAESVGRAAADSIGAVWQSAGATMVDRIELEMVTRAVPLGPDPRTFSVRGGELRYAAWDGVSLPDGQIFAGAALRSPVDEFNAPYGAALCGAPEQPLLPTGGIPGTEDLPAYSSCVKVDQGWAAIAAELELPAAAWPLCGATRTLISAIRLGPTTYATLPGEPVTLLRDALLERSPAGADHTVVIGYAQGHVGYLLRPEDWLQGGYEPSINLWGPLEGEYIMERELELLTLLADGQRHDGAAGGASEWVTPTVTDDSDLNPIDSAPLAGTVPDPVPPEVYARAWPTFTQAEPAPSLHRLESARFVWLGEDPRSGTPRVVLEREVAPDVWQPVTRRSGRVIDDADLLLTWTPLPLAAHAARTHYWSVEWQAVSWLGIVESDTPAGDDLADRAGAPLGRYRFAVTGPAYSITSDPFTVTPAILSLGAVRAGGAITVSVALPATGGWRLLHLTAPSNLAVPVVGPRSLHVEAFDGAELVTSADLVPDDAGQVRLPVAADQAVTSVHVSDAFVNSGEVSMTGARQKARRSGGRSGD
jgi:neutral ceramidase